MLCVALIRCVTWYMHLIFFISWSQWHSNISLIQIIYLLALGTNNDKRCSFINMLVGSNRRRTARNWSKGSPYSCRSSFCVGGIVLGNYGWRSIKAQTTVLVSVLSLNPQPPRTYVSKAVDFSPVRLPAVGQPGLLLGQPEVRVRVESLDEKSHADVPILCGECVDMGRVVNW